MPYFSVDTFDSKLASQYPEMARLIAQTKELSGAHFWELTEPLKEFFKTDFTKRFLEAELWKINVSDNYDALIYDFGIELIRFSKYSLWIGQLQSATFWESEQTELASFANDVIYCNLGPGLLDIELYQAPSTQKNEVFDRTQRPTLIDHRLQGVGEILSLRAGQDILKIVGIERDTFQIYVVSSAAKSLVWHYDYETLAPIYCSAGRGRASTIHQALEILARLGSKRSSQAIKKAYASDDHFVRWSAVRVALALDQSEGAALLELAKNDSHPHVRAAARKTESIIRSLPSE